MKGFVHNADQAVYINGLQMSGISSMDATYTIPAEENNFLGYVGPADLIQNAPGVGNFSFQRVMMSSDEPITELLLMDDGFDGGIEFNSQEINFQSGYINSYECSFAVDSLPQSTVSISAYGEVGPSVVKQKSTANQKELFTPTSSGISIDFDGRQTNRVTSFSFSNMERTALLYCFQKSNPLKDKNGVRSNQDSSNSKSDFSSSELLTADFSSSLMTEV